MITYDTKTKILDMDGSIIYTTGKNVGVAQIRNAVFVPAYERVPEGAFTLGKGLQYHFGHNQVMRWNHYENCYLVTRCGYKKPCSPYLIPDRFDTLDIGRWLRFQMYYQLKIDREHVALPLSNGGVSIGSLPLDCEILRVSEVLP